MLRKIVGMSLTVMATLVVVTTAVLAVPPHPDAIEQFKAQGVWEKKIAQLRGADSTCNARIAERQAETDKRAARTAALSDGEVDTMRALVILVDFPDFGYDSTSYNIPGGGQLNSTVAGTPAMFDSMLFTQRGIDTKYNPTGSMTEFYLQTSHGKLLIIGDVYGWYEMPQNYSWYVGNDDGLGAGGPILARHAATAAANAGVDFSLYANGSYQLPGFMVVHAGPGAETGAYGIWSHQGSMDISLVLNGVSVSAYAMDPEEMYNTLSSMGVFSHEWGHVLGLPDWYDVSYQGEGLGNFSLMAGGSWNNNGRSPALLDAVSRTSLSYTQAIPILQNTKNVPLAQVETGGPVYILNYSPTPPYKNEFWYVENRQKTGLFDSHLPGEGLLIYHYDSFGSQSNPARYKLALEQADGWDQLGVPVSGHNANGGDAGDPWPGTTNNRNFWDFSIPNAHLNADGAASKIGVLNISNSDSLMYAEMAVTYSKPWVVLSGDSVVMTDNAPGGDGDGILEQGETINMVVTVRNLAKQSFRPRCTVSVDQPGISFLTNNVMVGVDNVVNNVSLNPGTSYKTQPIIFQIPSSQWSTIATFTITVISDTVGSSNQNGTDRTYVSTMTYEKQIGLSQLLLVDDDNGRSDHSGYVDAFNTMGLLYDRWSKADSGSPTEDVLSGYSAVLWMTGSSLSGGTLTAVDVAAMKGYLDAGGNLSLASMKAASQLDALDSAFLADYFHVSLPGGSRSANHFRGLAGHPVGDSLRYRSADIAAIDSLTVVGSALPAFRGTNSANTIQYGISGVSYEGTYRTVFLSFAIEFIMDDAQASGFSPKTELLSRLINFLTLGSHTAVDDPSEPTALPGGFALEQNYPNPFNPSTVIEYTVNPGKLTVTNLSVYNVLGRKVATLVDAVQGPGTYRVEWDGRSSDGSRAATGVYMYRLTRGDNVESRKMLLLK
jgi:M6 family metalloprotease-like protein